jgi:hypothetical protein
VTPEEAPASLFVAVLVVERDGSPDLRRVAEKPSDVVDELTGCMQDRLGPVFEF